MFCKKCGKQIKDGMLFCSSCGTKVTMPQAKVNNAPQEKATVPTPIQREEPKEKEPMPTVQKPREKEPAPIAQKSVTQKPQILTIVIGVLVVVIVILVCVMFFGKSDKKEDEASQGYEEAMADVEDEPKEVPLPVEEPAPVEEPVQEEPVAEPEEPASQYFLPESDSRYMTMQELEGFTAADCRLARNELYARHGRRFDDENLQAHFDSCEWYQGTIAPSDFDESVLNEYELANRDLIVQYESVLEARGLKGTTTYVTYDPQIVTFEISNGILTVVADDGSRFGWGSVRTSEFSISYPIAEDCKWEDGYFVSESDFMSYGTTDYETVKSYIERVQAGYMEGIEELQSGEHEINSPMGIYIELTDGIVVKVYTLFP